jgi:hypothetical protein
MPPTAWCRRIPAALAIAVIIGWSLPATAGLYQSALGYSIELPDGWEHMGESDSQDVFYDAAGGAKSYLSVIRHPWQSGEWSGDESWTRSHLISYLITARLGSNPWGSVVWYDSSSSAATLGDLWAPEAYTRFFSADATAENAWGEYIIFTSSNQVGYEIYAIGDTTDMNTNVITYSSILRSIRIVPNDNANTALRPMNQSIHTPATMRRFDLRGRLLPRSDAPRSTPGAAGITVTITPERRSRRVERAARIRP